MPPNTSHFRTPLHIPYPRPSRLSDPHRDFSDSFTRAILAKPDALLTWNDFKNILGPFLPAGTYEESVYFLPLAFEYIASHDDDALDLITSIVWFISEYTDRLAADGLLPGSRRRVVECFQIWTRHFEVIHFDHAACRAKGWGLRYFDYVRNSEVICQGTCDLVRFSRHADLAEDFVRSLANHGADPAKAAWFLELSRSRTDVYRPPEEHPVIQELLGDENLIRSAASFVRSSLMPHEPSPTYWRDTLRIVEGV